MRRKFSKNEDYCLIMATRYEDDVIAWSREQADILKTTKFEGLDAIHIADELEDVGKSMQRHFAQRISALCAQIIKSILLSRTESNSQTLRLTPLELESLLENLETNSKIIMRLQKEIIGRQIVKTPSLKDCFLDEDWLAEVWGDAVSQVASEIEIDLSLIPKKCPWTLNELLS